MNAACIRHLQACSNNDDLWLTRGQSFSGHFCGGSPYDLRSQSSTECRAGCNEYLLLQPFRSTSIPLPPTHIHLRRRCDTLHPPTKLAVTCQFRSLPIRSPCLLRSKRHVQPLDLHWDSVKISLGEVIDINVLTSVKPPCMVLKLFQQHDSKVIRT
jgi:hypothetical protein